VNRSRLHRLGRLALLIAAILGPVVLLVPDAALAAAAGNDVGKNIGNLLRHYAAELYGGILAIISVFFLLHRRYGELGLFLFASVIVAWLVFSPDNVASAARAIGRQIL